jgi:AraC family ethanolamine operon transcriptional activator
MNVGAESAWGGERGKNIILKHRFSDIDQLAEQLQVLSKVQLTQLSTDLLQCDVSMALLDEAILFFAKTSCPILTTGEKYKDFIGFNFVLETNGRCVISHKRRVSPNILFGFKPDLETNFITPANLRIAAVLIRRDVFQDYVQIMERSDLDEKLWAHNYISAPVTLPIVRNYLNQLHNLILHQPNFLQQSHLKKLILEDFIPLLVDAIPPMTTNILKPPEPVKRSQIVKEAEDYLMAHLDQPLTLKDLCEALHTSRTPLFNGFQEVFGVGPMEYLKVQRLHSVRRMLRAADPRTDSVTEIARRFGFWSAGHFTRDYKQMFGELPSATLRQTSTS